MSVMGSLERKTRREQLLEREARDAADAAVVIDSRNKNRLWMLVIILSKKVKMSDSNSQQIIR